MSRMQKSKVNKNKSKNELNKNKGKTKERKDIGDRSRRTRIASDLKEMYDVGTGGCKYMGSALDVFSRYAMIIALKTKGEFKSHYENIVAWYTTQTGRPFKKWTTDGGGEMNNKQTEHILYLV